MSIEHRESKRIPLRSKIKYGIANRLENVAICSDLSETGVCIRTNNILEQGTKILMRIEFDGRNFDAEGVVMWARQVPKGLEKVKKSGMGVRFTEVDEELINIYVKRGGK